MPNLLSHETSPYLLQHARNPVDWFLWGPEAIDKAGREERPIFLSIGYAACHWCHVMAHESFEDADTAAFLNAHFVSIKVDRDALEPALHALNSMARGGMYDVVGGGFSRYSTDTYWRVPHFEKMLYDNAQLARVYLHAWQITGQPDFYRVMAGTIGFVARELTHPEGGFCSALDADSEGVEGKFYLWTREEIRAQLAENSAFFEAAYGVTEHGNWEGSMVLQRILDDAALADRFGLDPESVPSLLAGCHARLLAARAKRPRPATDDKILTAWNGLMLATLAEAARAPVGPAGARADSPPGFQRGFQAGPPPESWAEPQAGLPLQELCYNLAVRNADFLLTALRPGGKLRRSWREGRTTRQVFLDDYAALILGLLELYQTDFQERWYLAALELADEMIARFSDPQGGFFDTPADSEPLIMRPKEVQDNAIPSGGALACEALLKLAAFTGKGDYRSLAEQSLTGIGEAALRYPTAFAQWLSAADFALTRGKQAALLGQPEADNFQTLIQFLRAEYRPGLVVAASAFPPSASSPALLKDRPLVEGRATLYLCEDLVCRQPVTQVDQLAKLL